jgi:DNA repair photolyase
MQLYIPSRIIITPTANEHPRTIEIVKRIKIFNPQVEIIYSDNQMPQMPSGLNRRQQQQYLDKTLLLCTRSAGASFIEVFASPGNVTEGIGVMGKIASHCPLHCEFCYLLVAGRGTPWNRVYVDLERFREEAKKEVYVHKMSLTLWSAISFYEKKPLMKVPKGFKELCDNKIRKAVLANKIQSHEDSLQFLSTNLRQFFKEMNIKINKARFKIVGNNLPRYYRKNKKIPLWINIGEYTDILGIDHLTGNLDEILSWMNEDKELRIKFRTKAPYIKNILKHKNLDRIRVTVDLNTDFAIKSFQPNTFPLSDRFKAVKKLITAGAKVKLAIEPIIKYPGFEEEYVNLFQKIEKEIDIKTMDDVKIGCVRYKTQLKNYIGNISPDINLFNEDQQLVPPAEGDKRWRYLKEERVRIYSLIINSLKPRNRKTIQLCAEEPEVWRKLNLNPFVVHNGSVYQHH